MVNAVAVVSSRQKLILLAVAVLLLLLSLPPVSFSFVLPRPGIIGEEGGVKRDPDGEGDVGPTPVPTELDDESYTDTGATDHRKTVLPGVGRPSPPDVTVEDETAAPTQVPKPITIVGTIFPTSQPQQQPQPRETPVPSTVSPTSAPTTRRPTLRPTRDPSTEAPSRAPVPATPQPTTVAPSDSPTDPPSARPSADRTLPPSADDDGDEEAFVPGTTSAPTTASMPPTSAPDVTPPPQQTPQPREPAFPGTTSAPIAAGTSPPSAPVVIPPPQQTSQPQEPTNTATPTTTMAPTIADDGSSTGDSGSPCSTERTRLRECYDFILGEGEVWRECDTCLAGRLPRRADSCEELEEAMCDALTSTCVDFCRPCRVEISDFFGCAFMELVQCDVVCDV